MTTVEELEALLAGGHELRSLEAKGPGMVRQNPRFVAKVARAVMAMGNLRDGGSVVVGIGDDQVAAMLPGLSEAEAAEWTDFDLVSALLGQYSDPPVLFELHRLELSSSATVIVLEVAQFDQDIHICKKDFQGVLKGGQTYVRSRGKPESVPVPSSAEARELHNLAIDKGVREFIRRAGAAGLPLTPAAPTGELDEASFRDEYAVAWEAPTPVTSPEVGGIGSWVDVPAYFDSAVSPRPYAADRLRPGALDRFVTEHAVRLRGWPVPYFDQGRPLRHGTWVGQDVVALPHVEAWRMFTSGQFLHRRMLASDLRQSSELRPTVPGVTQVVAVWDVLFYMVELAEFGARLATTLATESISFAVALDGIAGRELVSGDWDREIHGPYVADGDRFETEVTVESATLLEDSRGIGVRLTQGLLQQFGLDIPDQVYLDWQEKTLRR